MTRSFDGDAAQPFAEKQALHVLQRDDAGDAIADRRNAVGLDGPFDPGGVAMMDTQEAVRRGQALQGASRQRRAGVLDRQLINSEQPALDLEEAVDLVRVKPGDERRRRQLWN